MGEVDLDQVERQARTIFNDYTKQRSLRGWAAVCIELVAMVRRDHADAEKWRQSQPPADVAEIRGWRS